MAFLNFIMEKFDGFRHLRELKIRNSFVLKSEYLDTFIDLAESRMARDLRLREMESVDATIQTVSGTQAYDLPTGYLEARYVLLQSTPYNFLSFMAPADFFRVYRRRVGSFYLLYYSWK